TGQTIRARINGSVESSRRMSLDVTAAVPGKDVDVKAVVYDGSAYVSTDGGASYRTLPTPGSVADQYGPGQALEYLQSMGSVTDTGSGTVDGISVEKYHATLDEHKLAALVEKAVGGTANAQLHQLFSTLKVRSAAVDVGINKADQIVSESGVIDA